MEILNLFPPINRSAQGRLYVWEDFLDGFSLVIDIEIFK